MNLVAYFVQTQKIYQNLKQLGIDVLLDNRDERPGVKFKDMDLIGIPLRLTVGKKIENNLIEVKERISEDYKEMSIDDALEYTNKYIKDNLK